MREYKQLSAHIKAEDVKEDGTFEGYISTFGGPMDSYRDIVDYGAFTDTIAHGGRNRSEFIPTFVNHTRLIGKWIDWDEMKKGLWGKAQINMEVPYARDVHAFLKAGDMSGMSFSFDVLEKEYITRAGVEVRHLKKLELWEAGPVDFPANINTSIGKVKSDIKSATTKREVEKILRDVGLSNGDAKFVASNFNLRDEGEKNEILEIVRK